MTDDERRQQELDKEKKVTVTLYLSEERMTHIKEYGDNLGSSCSLTTEECTIFSVLDQIYESAVERNV